MSGSFIGSELRELRKENVRLNRKLALGELGGIVAERDPQTRKVRLDLGEDPETGQKVLGPWVRVQSGSAGKFKSFVLPSIGEQMTLSSASGVIGADSVARYGTFTDENPHPQQEPDEAVLFENGKSRIAIKDGRIIHKVGDSTTTIEDGKIVTAIAGSTVTHTAEAVEVKSGASTHTVATASVQTKSARVKFDAPITETTGRTELDTGGVLA